MASFEKKQNIAVIGAGLTGLCSMKYFLQDSERYNVTGFEQAADLGGIWRYPDGCEQNRDVPESSPYYCRTYRNLRLNTPTALTHFGDFPFPPGERSFIPRGEMLDYLRSYAGHFEVIPHIIFRRQVLEVRPLNDENADRKFTRWALQEINLDTDVRTNHIFDAVIVCNGHFHKPYLPENFPGLDKFCGLVIHSSVYRVPEEYTGKRVLIVGGRSSSTDLTCELARVAQKVIVSWHRATQIFSLILPNVLETSDIWTLTANGVILENGMEEALDCVIFCTGFQHNYPFLHPDCNIQFSRGRVYPLFRHMISCHHPSMAFMGVYSVAVFNPIIDFQVKYFKAVLDGKLTLPTSEEMIADTEADFEERKAEGQPEYHAHKMEKRLFPYIDKLAAELGVPSYDPVIAKMFKTLGPILIARPYEIKSYRVRRIDAENFEHFLPEDHEPPC